MVALQPRTICLDVFGLEVLEFRRGWRCRIPTPLRLVLNTTLRPLALLFVLALAVPILRSFYELANPTGDALAAWAVGAALGLGGMLAALRLVHA